MKLKSQNNFFLPIVGLAVVAILLLMFGRIFGRLAFLMIAVSSLIYIIYQLIEGSKTEIAYKKSHSSKIDKKLNYCEKQIEVNETEVKIINTDIEELNESLGGYHEVNAANKTEAKKLIAAFEKERNLRQVKIDFFKLVSKNWRRFCLIIN